jgi:hypothetical protein
MSKSEKKKYGRVVFKSPSLWRVLNRMRTHYRSEHEPRSLVVPYVVTCAIYLESKLNESLFQFSTKRYGDDVATALMSLSFGRKLNVLVPLLTDGQYTINKAHFIYQRLVSLIRVRNSIAHPKPESEEIWATEEDLLDLPVIGARLTFAQIPKQMMDEPDITLGASKAFTPLEYHEALEKLEKWFFDRCPDKLTKVALVVNRSKGEKPETPGIVTYELDKTC